METNMLGKNAWGLEIRPCDNGYVLKFTAGTIDRINKDMTKAKINNTPFPETHIFTDEVSLRTFLKATYPMHRFVHLRDCAIFVIKVTDVQEDEWGDYILQDEEFEGINVARDGSNSVDYVIRTIRERVGDNRKLPKQYRVNYSISIGCRRCPNCGYGDYDWDESDLNMLYGESYQSCTCNSCGCQWTEYYDLMPPSKIVIDNREDVYLEPQLFNDALSEEAH